MLKGCSRVLLAFALALAASCGGATEDPNTLVINNSTEPQTLDPALEKGQPEYHVTIALFEGLTVYDPKDLSVKPGVAEKWDISPDGTEYTFHLRAAKWSNGDPVTAQDFEWSWKRVLDPALGSEYVEQVSTYLKNGKAYYDGAAADGTLKGWADTAPAQRAKDAKSLPGLVQRRHGDLLKKLIDAEKDDAVKALLREASAAAAKRDDALYDQVGVRAKDERTLVVTLEAPTAYFLDLAAFFTYFPVHRKSVEKHGKDWTRAGNLVGNGPFRLQEWEIKKHLLLDRNPHYWDAANVSDLKLKFLPIENATTAFNLYEKGRIHWLTDVPRDYIEELLNRPDYHTGPFLTTYFYGFNATKGVTKDKRVRQALARAVDRQKIAKYITRAGEIPAESLVPPGLPGYEPAKTSSFDPEAAKKLLADAGYPGGKGFPKIEILYNTQEAHKKIASAIQEMWRQTLNIEVELRNAEWKVYLDMQSRMEFDVIRRAWIADYNDPNTFLDMFTSANGNNNTGFANPQYDQLVAAAAKERDAAKRMKLLHDAEALLMDELPIVPIYFYVTKNMWKPEVQGISDNVRDTHPYNRIRLAGEAGEMIAFLLKRLAGGALTLFVIATLSFFMTRFAPGSPFTSERKLPPEAQRNLERRHNLDKPLIAQYFLAMKGYLHGELGSSFKYEGKPAEELLYPSFGTSLQLGLLAFCFSLLMGIPLGIVAARGQNGVADHAASTAALTGICVPNFLLGPLLQMIFALYLLWLPVAGWPSGFGGEEFLKILLPTFTLSAVHIAYVSRLTRAGMLDVLHKDYIRTARAKGVDEKSVFLKHALKNGITPVLSYAGPMAAYVFTGSVVVEKVFNIPGMGQHFVDAVFARDYVVIMGAVLIYSSLVIVLNILVDIGYSFLDPRVRLT